MDLSTARTIVAEHLDDTGNDRWSTAQIDRALQYALDSCIIQYLSSGGDKLNKVLSTPSTNGVVDMSSIKPRQLLSVTMLVGQRYYPLQEVKFEERRVVDVGTKSLQIVYAPNFVLPSNSSHPLVGDGATAANSFDSLEHWICARAAQFCAVKDAETLTALKAIENELITTINMVPPIPKAVPFPDKPYWYSAMFAYTWNPESRQLILCQSGWV